MNEKVHLWGMIKNLHEFECKIIVLSLLFRCLLKFYITNIKTRSSRHCACGGRAGPSGLALSPICFRLENRI